MIRRFLGVLVLTLACSVAFAQEQRTAQFSARWDVDSDTETFGVLTGMNGSAYGDPMHVGTLIETSGSSTTVTAVTASSAPFANLSVGDLIYVRTSPTNVDVRGITAKASSDSITIDAAADWSAGSGLPFHWRKFTTGTAATDGWVDTRGYADIQASVLYLQGDLATGLAARWWCRNNTDSTIAEVVYPNGSADCGDNATLASGFCQFATAGATASLTVIIPGRWDECRVGIKRNGADTSDAGANVESVTATITVGK